MNGNRAFTLLELLISLAVGAILLGIAMTGMAPARAAYAVRSGRSAFGTLVAHARAQAVERGSPVFFEFDPVGDSAWIRADTVIVEHVRFAETLGVDLMGTATSLCMTARGIADPACGNMNAPMDVSFGRAGRTVIGTLLVYGQFLAIDSVPPTP